MPHLVPSVSRARWSRRLALGLLIGLLGASWTQAQVSSTVRESITAVSATSTNAAVSFGFEASNLVIINDGSDPVFFTLASTTATTAAARLDAGQSFTISRPTGSRAIPGIGLICASTKTASVRVWAWE